GIDFDYTRQQGHLSLYDPVLDRTELGRGILVFIPLFRDYGILVYFSEPGSNRPHRRFSETRGNFFLYFGKFFTYQLPGKVGPHIVFEYNGNYGKSETGYRPYFFHPGKIGNGEFYRISYKLLNVFRAQVWGYGNDLYLVIRYIGNRIQVDGLHGIPPTTDNGYYHQEHNNFVLNRKADDLINHANSIMFNI